MKLRWIAAAAFALVVLACLPTGAGAKIRHDGPPVGKLTRFELEGSNGYSILVVTNRRQRLMLKTKHEGFVAEYWTRDALASPDRVQAKLPGLGSISVRFHPRGSVRHPSPPECEKPFPTVQPGVVRGTIKFVGEHEYTRVEAHEAKAEIEEPTSWSCSFAPYEEPIVPGGGEWDSKLITSALGVELLARKYQPGGIEGGGALYHVETAELLDTDPSLIVYRSAMVTAPGSTFQDAHPEHTTISPPAPFVGTGRLARTPESVFTWTGDLAVRFPGVDPVPLAGPRFEIDYCLRHEGCIRQYLDH